MRVPLYAYANAAPITAGIANNNDRYFHPIQPHKNLIRINPPISPPIIMGETVSPIGPPAL